MKAKLYIIISLLLTASLLPQQALADGVSANYAAQEDSLVKRFNHYVEVDDKDNVIACLDQLIKLREHAKRYELLAEAVAFRIAYFYGHDMNDSVYQYVPEDMKLLSAHGQWNAYYNIWALLANTYLYAGKPNQALRVAQDMFQDAKNRNHQLGMGTAYYTLGSVYTILNVLDESVNNYQKGMEIMSNIHPYPTLLADLYPYYSDVLNLKKDYAALDGLTKQWQKFLPEYIKENQPTKESVQLLYATYYIACSQAAMGLDRLSEADEMMAKAKENISDETDYTGMSWLLNMGKLRYQEGRYQEALAYNNRRLNMPDAESDASSYLDVIKQRAEILMKLGRFEEAAQYFEKVYVINDSINVQDTKSQLNEMNTLFQVDELKMAKEREQFRLMMIIVGVIVLALVIFIVFRIRSARRLKKAHDQLQQTHEELLTAYDQLEETTTAKERIESDLRIARDIQQSMIPQKFPPFPERTDIDLYASMTPAKAVGGDLYDFILLDEKLYFCLGDVSGKGVPASLFMAVARNLFRVVSQQGLPPAEIADKLNNALSEDNESGMFVTMFIGVIDLPTGHLDFCNAGHNPPVIKMPDGTTHFIDMQPNAPLGLWPGLPYDGESIDDISGQPFFVYSDGLNEAEDDQQEQYGDDLLLEMLEKHPFNSSQETVEMMKADVARHANGAEQSDDLTMLCVKVKGHLTN